MRISDWSSDVCSSDLGFSLGSSLLGGDLSIVSVQQVAERIDEWIRRRSFRSIAQPGGLMPRLPGLGAAVGPEGLVDRLAVSAFNDHMPAAITFSDSRSHINPRMSVEDQCT